VVVLEIFVLEAANFEML